MTFGCRSNLDKTGVLIAQLGSPEAPTAAALRPYLRQFLSDPRVIEAPRLLWWFILNAVILMTRPARSARAYGRIWTKDGSPLIVLTNSMAKKVGAELKTRGFDGQIEVGMRYGNPSLESAIDRLIAAGCSRILLVPLYAQYAAATTASVYDVVFKHLLKRRYVPTLRVIDPYFRDPRYIDALSLSINDFLAREGEPDKLVFSYHGIPEAYINKGDPYCCTCTETTETLLPKLKIPREKVIHTYQSRFGKDPWLVPYTDETLKALAAEDISRVYVASPSFVIDCLETLDEIGNEGCHLFEVKAGKSLKLIPCLNDSPVWISALSAMIEDELHGWKFRKDACTEHNSHTSCIRKCPVAEAKLRAS